LDWEEKNKDKLSKEKKTKDLKQYIKDKKESTFVKFFRVSGTDMDKEVNEYVQGIDLVRKLKSTETNYKYIQNYMLVTCVFVFIMYTTAIPLQFDFDLAGAISKAAKESNKEFPFTKCSNPRYSGEKENKVGLFFMIICHIFMGHFVSNLSVVKTGFLGSFKYLNENSKKTEFRENKWTYIIVSTVCWLAFGAIALFINLLFGSTGVGGDKLPDGCDDYKKQLFWNSMINLWIVTDVIIMLVTMPALTLNFYWDKNFDDNQFLELIVNTHNNALRNFYKTDKDAGNYEEERETVNKLTSRIYEK